MLNRVPMLCPPPSAEAHAPLVIGENPSACASQLSEAERRCTVLSLLQQLSCSSSSMRASSAQELALLSEHRASYRSLLLEANAPLRLRSQLANPQSYRDSANQTAVAAMLTALFCLCRWSDRVCASLCNAGLEPVLRILEAFSRGGINAECAVKALSLLTQLAASGHQASLLDQVVLPALIRLRNVADAGVQRHLRLCLDALDCRLEELTEAHFDLVKRVVSLGFRRDAVERALLELARAKRSAVEPDDLDALLDVLQRAAVSPLPQLLDMGFSPPDARAALAAAGGLLDSAVEQLLCQRADGAQRSELLSLPSGEAHGDGEDEKLAVALSVTVPVSPSLVSPSAIRVASASRERVDVAVLHAMPLQEEPNVSSRKLRLECEKKELARALQESGHRIFVSWEAANRDRLLKAINHSRALHISAHGSSAGLVLEDGEGGHTTLKPAVLRQLLAQRRPEQLQLVFVATCSSYPVAEAFVAAGIAHVVAIPTHTAVKDCSARTFSHSFYYELCRGSTVREAFDRGKQAVMLAESGMSGPTACCCVHHSHIESCKPVNGRAACCTQHQSVAVPGPHRCCCQPSCPHEEHEKFVLLPVADGLGDQHEVALFQQHELQLGGWVDLSSPEPLSNLPLLIIRRQLHGRGNDAAKIIRYLSQPHRLVWITGNEGVGKSALAMDVAAEMQRTRAFPVILHIPLRTASAVEDLLGSIQKQVANLQQWSPHIGSLSSELVSSPAMLQPLLDALHPVGHKCVLILLDDCDSLASCGWDGFLAELLDRVDCRVLLTSRQKLGISPDRAPYYLYRLEPLGLHDAYRLLMDAMSRPDASLACHPLVKLMSGIPQLVLLCAALLEFMMPGDVYDYLCLPPEVSYTDRVSMLDHSSSAQPLPSQARSLLRTSHLLLQQSGYFGAR